MVNDLIAGQAFLRRCKETMPPEVNTSKAGGQFPAPDWIAYVERKTGLNVIDYIVNGESRPATGATGEEDQ